MYQSPIQQNYDNYNRKINDKHEQSKENSPLNLQKSLYNSKMYGNNTREDIYSLGFTNKNSNLTKNNKNDYIYNSFNSLSLFIENLNLAKELKPILNDQLNSDVDNDLATLNISKYSIDIWTDNFKRFIIGSLIPSVLEEHSLNLNSLNRNLACYNIFLTDKLQNFKNNNNRNERNERNIVNEISRRLAQKNYDYDSKNETKENDDEELEIFYGDTHELNILNDLLRRYKLEKERTHHKLIKNTHSQDFLQKTQKNLNIFSNTGLFKNKNDKDNFFDLPNVINNKEVEENLELVIDLLEERKKINSRIIPDRFLNNIHMKNQILRNLIIYYSFQRLESLKLNRLNNFQNASGGKFDQINQWFTGLPTDSQVNNQQI